MNGKVILLWCHPPIKSCNYAFFDAIWASNWTLHIQRDHTFWLIFHPIWSPTKCNDVLYPMRLYMSSLLVLLCKRAPNLCEDKKIVRLAVPSKHCLPLIVCFFDNSLIRTSLRIQWLILRGLINPTINLRGSQLKSELCTDCPKPALQLSFFFLGHPSLQVSKKKILLVGVGYF